jgi:hypothetical protein
MAFKKGLIQTIQCINCHNPVALGKFFDTNKPSFKKTEEMKEIIEPIILCENCKSNPDNVRNYQNKLTAVKNRMTKSGIQMRFTVTRYLNKGVVRHFHPADFYDEDDLDNLHDTMDSFFEGLTDAEQMTLVDNWPQEAWQTGYEFVRLKKLLTVTELTGAFLKIPAYKTRIYSKSIEIEKPKEFSGLLVDEFVERVVKMFSEITSIDEYDTYIRIKLLPNSNRLDKIFSIWTIMQDVIDGVFG